MRNYKMLWVLLFLLFIPLASHALEYKLRMSKNDELCGYVDKTYNFGTKWDSNVGSEKINIFSRAEWAKLPRSKTLLNTYYTYVDINNNGIGDVVVRDEFTRNNLDMQSIIIHNKENININKGYALENYKKNDGRIALSAFGYPLYDIFINYRNKNERDKVPDDYKMSFFTFDIFVYSKVTYLSISDYINAKRKKWLLIAKYNGGSIVGRYKDSDKNVLSDICYFEIIN